MSNESSWSTDSENIGRISPWPSGWGPEPQTPKCRALTPRCPMELLSANIVKTKVVRYDENSYFKLFGCTWPSGWGPESRTTRSRALTLGCPRKWLFSNFVQTKVIICHENIYFKLFLDVNDHLGEVRTHGHQDVGHWPRGVPGNDFLEMLLKPKLVCMIKIVIHGSC